jgi:acetyl-CoA carboxylase carboxyltransferase component
MSESRDLTAERPELTELRRRIHATTDEGRPDAVARRRKTGQRTTRENIADLVDHDSFIEYGGLALAAQRQRHNVEELVKNSPADGFVAGIGTINAAQFGREKARSMVLAYDYTVFAGTQGGMGHKKLDRMLALAAQWRLPIVLFAEGGGGRPNDTDMPWVAGLDTPGFLRFAALSGVAPRVGIVSGRCFAGNAVLLGSCDVIIATENSNIGMAGPAMIEGGGLGVCKPEEIGPIDVQSKNGVVDIRVADEAEAVAAAKKYLTYFQGALPTWTHADQTKLRDVLPERRRRAYKIRPVIELLADTDSVLEVRKEFGLGIVTALVRIEGKPLGLIANNPYHLGGAIDTTKPPGSCSFAIRLACQSFLCATRRGSWWGRKPKRRRWCDTRRECSPSRGVCACHFSRSCCAKGMVWERKRWRAGISTRHFLRYRGPLENSAGWASKAP